MRQFTPEEIEVLAHAVNKYGIKSQAAVAGEECTELARAVFRKLGGSRYDKENMMDEICDVFITAEQIVQHYRIQADVRQLRDRVFIGTSYRHYIKTINALADEYADIATEDVFDKARLIYLIADVQIVAEALQAELGDAQRFEAHMTAKMNNLRHRLAKP